MDWIYIINEDFLFSLKVLPPMSLFSKHMVLPRTGLTCVLAVEVTLLVCHHSYTMIFILPPIIVVVAVLKQ